MAQAAIIKKKMDMTDGAILPKIIRFSIPLVLTGILQLFFNTADTIVVGRWGGSTPDECETALAAVGSCGSLINLIINLFFGLSAGASICVAHDMGAKRFDEVKKTVQTSVLTALICGAIVTAFGILSAESLLRLMGTEEAVLGQAVPYMIAYFCGMPANMLYNYCASILRASGDSTRPLAFLSIAGVANVVLNLFMVISFGLGALGVGIATAASHWISCILIVIYMMRMDGPCKIDLKGLRIDKHKLKKITFIGLPAGLQGTLFSFSNVLIQSSVNSFGKVVVAGNAAASNLGDYAYCAQHALYQTALTFVGQNVGARRFDRVKKCILTCACAITVIGFSIGGAMYLFGEPLLAIFVPGNPKAIEVGMVRLGIIGVFYFLCGLMEVGCGAMRGLGKSITPTIVSLLGSCVFRVVWIYTAFAASPTLVTLYISYPISWILTAATHYIFAFVCLKRK